MKITEEMKRCALSLYLELPKEVADDVSRIIQLGINEIERLSGNKTSDQLKEHFSRKEEIYAEVFSKDGQDHEVYIDKNGTLRWRESPSVELLWSLNQVRERPYIQVVDLNEFWTQWYKKGFTKNDSRVRRLYRDMGYSVFGYWELFFWEVNNPNADEWEGEND